MGRLLTVSTQVELETEECCNCGVIFAMPASLRQKRSREGGSFYCPNGHGQHYTESQVDRLSKELLSEQLHSHSLDSQLNGALENLNTTKNELRRTKRRVNAGVCPHCQRHFTNVERHIHSKHPEEVHSN